MRADYPHSKYSGNSSEAVFGQIDTVQVPLTDPT
jgi:hypothetical protein